VRRSGRSAFPFKSSRHSLEHSKRLCRRTHHEELPPEGVDRLAELGAALVAASDLVYRDFPWRRFDDPYAIAVAEILLQKTRADKVAVFLPALLEKVPSARLLAAADEADLARVIGPLGLAKKRATLLVAFGQALVDHGLVALRCGRELPGLGEYGRRAVMCFAFSVATGIVDANVRRILKRALSLGPHCVNYYQDIADRVLSRARDPKRMNYALLDIGATFCRPAPRCPLCPLNMHCDYGLKAVAPGRTADKARGT